MSSGWVSAPTLRVFAADIKSVHAFTSGLAPSSGLDKIYEFTNTPTRYELRFDLGMGPDRAFAVYDNFKIAPAKQKFKLTIGKYSGTAGGPHAEMYVQNTRKDTRRQQKL